MKLLLRNTTHGLIPIYDDDFDEKKKLVIGKDYMAEIKLARNLMFHRKYFGMLDTAWYLLTEKRWQKSYKSIAFDKMDDAEFEKLYHAVYDTVMSILSMNGTTQEQFNAMIDNFQ